MDKKYFKSSRFLTLRIIAIISICGQIFFPVGVVRAEEIVTEVVSEVMEVVVIAEENTPPPVVEEIQDVIDDVVETLTGTSSETTSSETATSTATALPDVATSTATSTPTESATSSNATSTATSTATTSTTTINTGDAIAVANVLNMVNTNIVNSDGQIIFANMFDQQFGTIDFRNPASSTIHCGLMQCDGQEVKVNLVNDAYIDNGIALLAVTGNNTIQNAGNGVISTGNAYAGLNLVNIANTNLINSNYMIIAVNAFRGIDGDIVFPSLTNFTIVDPAAAEVLGIHATSTADILNNINTDAQSGDNETDNVGSSTIHTGNTDSMANLFNQINSSLIGGNSLSILFRVTGNWTGEIFGLPSGFEAMQGDDGSIYIYASSTAQMVRDLLEVHSSSTAVIHNDVDVQAHTGENLITDADSALISTGDAFAGVNLINIANANVVSRNWMLAIINIFGDFNGDIAFGRPDLWIGGRVSSTGAIQKGSDLTYTLTVTNNGDSLANNVVVRNTYNSNQQQFQTSSLTSTEVSPGIITWDIGSLAPGESREITYNTLVQNVGEAVEMLTTLNVSLHETDNNLSDNADVVSVRTNSSAQSGTTNNNTNNQNNSPNDSYNNSNNNNVNTGGFISDLKITRITASSTLTAGGAGMEQEIVIHNPTSQTITNVTVRDILHDVRGKVVRSETFNLDDILPNEEITIKYNISFGKEAEAGMYTFSSLVKKPGAVDMLVPFNGRLYVVPATVIPVANEAIELGNPIAGVYQELIKQSEPSRDDLEGFKDLFMLRTADAADSITTSNLSNDGVATMKSMDPLFLIIFALIILFIVIRLASRKRKPYYAEITEMD